MSGAASMRVRRRSEIAEAALALWRDEMARKPMQMARKSTPYKRSPEREQIVLTALEWGATWKAAAKLAGVCTQALDQWRRADPVFAAAVLEARERLHAKQREALSDCEEEQ